MAGDFFCARLDQMIDLKPPLAVLAQRMLWEQIEKSLGPSLAHKSQLGKEISEADLFGPIVALAVVGISNACRQKLSIRLIASLLYLNHANNLNDEAAVEFWSGNVFWQHFIDMEYYELKLPCDATQLRRFRTAIGEAGVEELLMAAIDVAVTPKAVKPTEFERVIVGSTVQENVIANPMDSQLLEIARHKVVRAAEAVGIDLKQTYARENKELRRKPGGYVHAMKYHRLRKTVKHHRTNLGFLYREALCEQFFYCASIS